MLNYSAFLGSKSSKNCIKWRKKWLCISPFFVWTPFMTFLFSNHLRPPHHEFYIIKRIKVKSYLGTGSSGSRTSAGCQPLQITFVYWKYLHYCLWKMHSKCYQKKYNLLCSFSWYSKFSALSRITIFFMNRDKHHIKTFLVMDNSNILKSLSIVVK